MKFKKFDKGNYEIYFCKNKKFKTILISTLIINNFNYDDVTKENVISDYLLNTNKNYTNEVLMSKKYLELYDPRMDIYDIFRDVHSKCFDILFLNEKYTEKGMNKKTVDFYYSLMFEPNIKNNCFDENNLKIIKNQIKTSIKMREENSNQKAYFGAMGKIREDIPLSKDFRPKIEDLEKIDNKELYKYYKNKLSSGKFIVYVLGDLSDEEVIDLIDSNLGRKVNKNTINYKKKFEVTKSNEELSISEKSDFNETIVYLIYKILNMTDRERYIVLPIFNEIIGGSSSKLFNNVREKNSLAYYVYSNIIVSQSIFYMYAGITKYNYDKTIKLMKKELNDMLIGNITDKEIMSAKKALHSSLLKIDDNAYGIVNNIENVTLFDGIKYDELNELYDSVTKEEIMKLGSKFNLDIIYMLEGAIDENN